MSEWVSFVDMLNNLHLFFADEGFSLLLEKHQGEVYVQRVNRKVDGGG